MRIETKFRLDRLFTHPGYLIWVVFVYVFFLGRIGIAVTGDEKQYLSIALEMFQSGSWLTPIQFGEPSYYKPPLQYWATLLSFKSFGLSLFSALLPSVVVGLITAFILGEVSKLLHERRNMIRSGFLFMVTAGAATYSIAAQMEMYLCLFLVSSWWAFLRYLHDPIDSRNPIFLYMAFFAAGLLALVKSPLYLVLWGMGLFSYVVVSGEWELIRVRHVYWGIVLGALVAVSWYFWAIVSDFDRFWTGYVVRETLQKSSGNQSSMFRMWMAFFYQSLPIVIIFLFGFRSLWRRRRTSLLLMFTVCYAWPFILFFSIFPYRVNNYLFVLTPVLAVWVDWVLSHERKVNIIRMGLALSQVVLLLVGFLFLILSFWFGLFSVWQNLAWVALILIGVVSLYRESIRGFLALSLGTIFCSLFLVAEISDHGYAGLRAYIRNRPTANLVMFDSSKDIWHEVGLVSLAVQKPIERALSYTEILEALRQKKTVILSDRQKVDLKDQILSDLDRVTQPHTLSEIPWTRWGRRQKISWKEVFAERDATQFKNLMSRDYWIISLSD